ncbi:MAG: hypothetical protein KIT56_05795 [Gammaproteobacteria bacterium]|nr:hypothetical protein [Gammaproteobacteria bacterium]MCW5583381.1 hypothetical protein [Gammaproteobacteria bacterium]
MLAKLLYGYKATQCLYVAAKLNIADHLKHSPKTIEELAIMTNSNADSLNRVMRCLIVYVVFQQQDKTFLLNPSAEDLLSDSKNTMKDFVVLCGEELYQAAGDLLYTVQTGKPAFNLSMACHIGNIWKQIPIKPRYFMTPWKEALSL